MSRKKQRRRQEKKRGKRRKAQAPVEAAAGPLRLWIPALFLLLSALVVSRDSLESFRGPKLLLTSGLVLASLILLSVRLRRVPRVEWRALLGRPVLRATLPLAVVVSLGLATTAHRAHVWEALVPFWIGLAGLAGWSLALSGEELRRILRLLAWPAAVLAAIGILQYHRLISLFEFQGEVSERIGLTSLAGGAFDLAAYLVLPALIAQAGLYRLHGEQEARAARFGWALTLLACLYAMAATQTLSALAALALGSLLFWLPLLPRRRLAAAAGVALLASTVAVVAMQPLRQRVVRKAYSLVSGDLNRALTGRLDGWKTAVWMFRQHPLTGVGHGAYRAAFGHAKLALKSDRETFFRGQHQTFFANAHSEPLEAAAEWGLPGLLALAWALFVLQAEVRKKRSLLAAKGRSGRAEAALLYAALAAMLLLALASFPLRIALVAYPQLLFLCSIFAAEEEA